MIIIKLDITEKKVIDLQNRQFYSASISPESWSLGRIIHLSESYGMGNKNGLYNR